MRRRFPPLALALWLQSVLAVQYREIRSAGDYARFSANISTSSDPEFRSSQSHPLTPPGHRLARWKMSGCAWPIALLF